MEMDDFDIGPLTWVKAEIDNALAAAHDALSSWNGEDLTPLKIAAAHLHQVYGALQIVDLQGVSLLTTETERLLLDMSNRHEIRTQFSAEVALKAIDAMARYLDGLVAGAPNTELKLAPIYQEIVTQRGGELPAPSELFFPNTDVRPHKRENELPLDDALRNRAIHEARSEYQRGLLQLLKNQNNAAALALMDQALRRIENLAPNGVQHSFWWATVGLLEALRRESLSIDLHVKRVFGRLDMQMRRLMEGSRQLAERLFREVLYHVAQDPTPSGRSAEVIELFQLQRYLANNPASSTTLTAEQQSHIANLREYFANAQEHWIRYCGGRTDNLASFRIAIAELLAAAEQLPNAAMLELVSAIRSLAERMPDEISAESNETLQIEMATALLLGQNAAEHFERLGEEFAQQSQVQTLRLQAALDTGFDTSTIPQISLLDEFSRNAQEKLLLDQVAQEIQSNLLKVEEILDRFFRDAQDRENLPAVPELLKQIVGALNMLQLDVACELVQETIVRVGHFSRAEVEIPAENLNWVAEALSTLGLYIDAIRHGKDSTKAMLSLLALPESGAQPEEQRLEQRLQEDIQRLELAVQQWLAQNGDENEVDTLLAELEQLAHDADLVGDLDLRAHAENLTRNLNEALQAQTELPSLPEPEALAPPSPLPQSSAAVDQELLEIYIEEAREVLENIRTQLARLDALPHDLDAFTTIRRSFHTLKGSGRMVGLTDLAEVAWELEQTLNHWLREERSPDQALLALVSTASATFEQWVETLTQHGHVTVIANDLIDAAKRLRSVPPQPETAPPETSAETLEAPPAPAAPLLAEAPERPEAEAPKAEVQETARPVPKTEPQSDTVGIGTHSLPTELFNIFSEEAAQRLEALRQSLAKMAQASQTSAWDMFAVAAHTLRGISRTTGFTPLADAAEALENWTNAWPEKTENLPGEVHSGLEQVLAHLSHGIGEIVARRFPAPMPQVQTILDALSPFQTAHPPETTLSVLPVVDEVREESAELPATPPEVTPPLLRPLAPDASANDDLDPQLLPIFLEEAADLLPRMGESLRAWRAHPTEDTLDALKRVLHTLKGSSRMAGATTLGERVHDLENQITEQGHTTPSTAFLDLLDDEYDAITDMVGYLQARLQQPAEVSAPVGAESTGPVTSPAVSMATTASPRDDYRLQQPLRLKPDMLDTLLNEAGEISIARARIDNVLSSYKQTAQELAANVERLRSQLREMEIQAESQMHSRLSQMEASHFDPLEFDRFSRLQELTRQLAESVNDVSTAQENLLSGLTEAENALTHQSRMARVMQQELMHMRMVPINTLGERLHRIVRQSAKETGRRAQMSLEGGQTELDRAVLEKIAAPLEHLVRNAVAHGIELPGLRQAAGKPEYGQINLKARQEGNEIVLTLGDDGAGVDEQAVRAHAEQLGWHKPGQHMAPEQLENILFRSGFSTAKEVTELAGRGIGLDVVKNEIASLGGRVRLENQPGQGVRFTIRLPLTLALSQVVLVRAGSQTWALPANLVTLVREVKIPVMHALHEQGYVDLGEEQFPLRTLAELVDTKSLPHEGQYRTIMMLKAGHSRLAVRVDAIEGNYEAVVKPIGPQLARIAGISGATVLGDGRVVLILNPFLLAERAPQLSVKEEEAQAERAPLVMVVDDSLTVRKITSRFLLREGYRVVTARDGEEALEKLEEETPIIMLLDIEMPRMDGFEVTHHVRHTPRTASLPIIMITSRTAEKHRQHAQELGVNVYLGKPYQEEDLLSEIRRLTGQETAVTA